MSLPLLVGLLWLIAEGIYPTLGAARTGIHRGEIPEEAVVRRGRRVFIRPDVITAWVQKGMPKPRREIRSGRARI